MSTPIPAGQGATPEQVKASNIIQFDPTKAAPIHCSFFGKQKHQVRRLVTNQLEGKSLRAICDECVEKAKQRLEEAA